MKGNKRILSAVLAFILVLLMFPNSTVVQAAQKQLIIPRVEYVKAPNLEYTAGDMVNFDLHTPNYGGRVQYRVVLWDDNKKEARDIWTTGDRYYTNWMPYGNNTFNLHWRIDEPGSYRITIYVKRAGIPNNKAYLKGQNCDSYMKSQAFVVKPRTSVLDRNGEIYGSSDGNKLETYDNDVSITGQNITLNNARLEGNLKITGDNALIRNVSVAGKIIIDPGKDGSCTLDSVTAKEIEVLSGGENSIHIINSSADALNVNSQSRVRIEVDGDTEIISTTANGYVIFDRKSGTFGAIRITKDENGETVVEFRGNIQDAVVVETAATIRTGPGSSISNLVVNTSNTVRLEGQYNNVVVNTKARLEVGANTNVGNIEANDDAEIRMNNTSSIGSIERNGNQVVIIQEGTIKPDTPAGNENNGDAGDKEPEIPRDIKVRSITITSTDGVTSIVRGSKLQMHAVVKPNNATDKRVWWSVVSGPGEISSNGLLTTTEVGVIVVKATARDGSSKYGTIEITVTSGTEEQNAPTGLNGIAPTTVENNDGKITGTTAEMEYKLASADESEYRDCAEGETTGLAAGNYVVRYKAKEDHDASLATLVTVPAYETSKSTNAALSDLKVDGVTVPGFSSEILTYNVELPAGTTAVPTAVAIAADAKAEVEITPAESLPGTTTIVVTAENEVTQRTYRVNFTLSGNQDQPAPTGLTGVAPTTAANNDGKITGTTADMEYKLASADDSEYRDCDDEETTGLSAGKYAVRYKAKTGYNASPAVAVTVPAYEAPKSTDASLSDLTVDGVTVSGFSSETLTYNVELPAGTTAVPTVAATAADAKANVVVTPAESLPGTTTIVVTAEDEETQRTYRVNFTVAGNQNQPAPTGLTGVAPTSIANNDGKITGTTADMEYKLASADDSEYKDCSEGETTGLAAGNYVVRYKAKTGYNASPTVAVTVPEYIYISAITVKTPPDKVTYIVGEALDLTGLSVTLTMSDSSKEDIAFADFGANGITTSPENGEILTLADTIITIAVDGKTAEQAITVSEVPQVISVSLEPSTATVVRGNTQQLTATVVAVGGAAQTVNWTSSDATGRVTVDETGLVTAAADAVAGNYTITATSTVDSSKFDTSVITVVLPQMTGTVEITGSLKYGSTLTAVTNLINAGTPTYQWNRSGAPIPGATEATYTLAEADITKTITVTVTADSNIGTGSITSAATGVIVKADGPPAPPKPVLESKTDKSITLEANPLNEFSRDNGATWQGSSVFTGLTSGTSYYFITRVKETATTNASLPSEGTTIKTDVTVSATASSMTTAPGTTTIALSQLVPGLAPEDILVEKDNIPLVYLNDYNIANIDTQNIGITFAPEIDLDRRSAIKVTISKPEFVINDGEPIEVTNLIPIAVKQITVTSASDATIVAIGGTLQMTATVLPEEADDKTITWTVESGTGNATITPAGVLQGTAAGTVTVKATNAASGVTATKLITVVAPVPVLNQLLLWKGADQGNTQVVAVSHLDAVTYKYKLQADSYNQLLYVGMDEPAGFSLVQLDYDIPALVGQHLIVIALNAGGKVIAATDYILTVDEVSVDPIKVYMADYNNNLIQACTTTNSTAQPLVTDVETNSYSGPMAITVSGGRIYWAEQDSQMIRSSALDGTDIIDVVNTGSNNITAIAVDEINSRIYWTDYTNNRICYASLSGGPIMTVISNADSTPGSGCGPVAMAISGQKIFWAGDSSSFIECANLDGSDRRMVVPLPAMPQNISGIAVDEVDNKIYWSEYGTNKISCAQLDSNSVGMFLGDVIINADKGLGIKGPLSIAIKNGRIYWVCDSTGEIRRARLDGTEERVIYTPLTPTFISGIDVE